jgi:peptidoglycan/xylan/chitin deacetylase (PgdA/CDA1 family)
MSVPFGERGGALRGLLDAVCGRLPRFVFGGRVASDVLPVFHFHDVTAADLEPKLRFLAENGYATTTSDEIAAYVRREIRLDGARVALCFDDAWASLWTVGAPLLKRHGLTAITYAIPARIAEAPACRPTIDEAGAPSGGPPFVTWPELRALQASGIVDVQCHTESHSMVFSSPAITGFVTPDYAMIPMLNRPQLSPLPALRFLEPDQLGAPLYEARSRMSDGRRVAVPFDAQARCVEYVAREGGARFFSRSDWKARLRQLAGRCNDPVVESEAERDRAIELELDRGRAILNDRLRTGTVNHICLPWGVSSARTAAALPRLGYRSAIANRMRGLLAVQPGDDPYWLKRLPNRYIFRLPGRGRRTWI